MAKKSEEDPKLIETEHERDKPLIAAARKYVKLRKEWNATGKAATEAKVKVGEMMTERKMDTYKHDGVTITLKHKDEVSVEIDEDEPEEKE